MGYAERFCAMEEELVRIYASLVKLVELGTMEGADTWFELDSNIIDVPSVYAPRELVS